MKDSSKQLGEGLAEQLGIEVQAPRAVPATQHATPGDAAKALAAYVGLPGAPADAGLTGVDRAIAIADSVAAGAQLSEADSSFLWSEPSLVTVFSKRLDLERAATGKGKRE